MSVRVESVFVCVCRGGVGRACICVCLCACVRTPQSAKIPICDHLCLFIVAPQLLELQETLHVRSMLLQAPCELSKNHVCEFLKISFRRVGGMTHPHHVIVRFSMKGVGSPITGSRASA